MVDTTKLEAMLRHILNQKGPTGKQWVSITVEGFPKFTPQDVHRELCQLRRSRSHWYNKLFSKFQK